MTLETLRPFEKPLVAVDDRPWDALWRMALGFVVAPVFSFVYRGDSGWALTGFLLLVLFALRLLPAVLRKVIGFSATAQSVWSERRLRAKHYDSYQWQKLFWLGLGLSVYLVIAGAASSGMTAVAAACLVSGGAGLIVWRGRLTQGVIRSHSAEPATKQSLLPVAQQKP